MSKYQELKEQFEEAARCPHCSGTGVRCDENNPDNEWRCNVCEGSGLTPSYQKMLTNKSI